MQIKKKQFRSLVNLIKDWVVTSGPVLLMYEGSLKRVGEKVLTNSFVNEGSL